MADKDSRRVQSVQSAIRQAQLRFGGMKMVRDAYGKEPCVYCGGPARSRDHIIPLSRGGLHSLENMVPACHRCNSIKRDMIPQDFFSRYPRFAWRFAQRAVHAHPAWRELAERHGRRYTPEDR